MRTLLVAVLLAFAVPAWAQPSALTEANTLLAEGEFERALKKLDSAVKRTSAPAELAALHVARGKCLLALSKRSQALAAFTAALEKDLSVEPGEDASPDAVALFEEARGAFPGTLTVTVDGEASVRLDGRDLGPAPLTTKLAHGEHAVEITSADGRRAQRTVQVQAGRAAELAVTLPPPAVIAPPVVTAPSPTASPMAEVPAATVTAERTTRSWIGWVPLGAGVAVAAAGGVALWQARVQYDRLTDPTLPPLTPEEEQAAVSTGSTLQTVGWVGVGVGAAAAVTGAVLLLWPSSDSAGVAARVPPLTPLVGVAPDGSAWLGLTGAIP